MLHLLEKFQLFAVPDAGLFFFLSGTVYLPGESVLITDIGLSNVVDAASSLVCATSNVNTRCCGDNGNMGTGRVHAEWRFPDGNIVPSSNEFAGFTRSTYTHQLRLNHRLSGILGPTGNYTCRVPDEVDSALIHEATITVITGKCRLVMMSIIIPICLVLSS